MVQRHLVVLAANAGLLVTTEGSVRRVLVVTIGPYAARLDGAAHAIGTVDVAGPETGTQTELGIVGDGQGFFFVLEGGYTHHRTKDFLLEHTHVVLAFEQRGLNVEAIVIGIVHFLTATAGQHFRAFLLADVEVGHDLVELLLAGLSADLHIGIERVATLDGLRAFNNLGHELLVHVFLYQRTGRTGTDLTLVEERQHQAFHTLVDKLRLSLHYV
mmetsp:Transcript_23668/g.38687  ORF Transcript_23668/g.38687 Transcript_23668/m.38687 type:complete len:215 (-) Transcript_23668:859-1503(-)